MAKKSDKVILNEWQEFKENTKRATPIDLNETAAQKAKRIEQLEKHPEKWFKYYFPNYYTAEPELFHIKATKRVLNNPEYYEVRSWSRELSKSVRTMMEVLYLGLTGKKRNVLMVSATRDDAARLLEPYRLTLENNQRIINDYGIQENLGSWEEGEFKTRSGLAFRALGARQSPRGTRNEAIRPDVILIDDIDTDKECRNPEITKAKIEWIEQALIPTRSISVPLLIIACGNIIAKYCCITELGKKADTHEIINIRDKNGKSTWPSKNTEEMIDRALKPLSTSSQQKEYYNNPVLIGDIFKNAVWGKCPPLSQCEQVLTYADPATSNKDKSSTTSSGSTKGVGVIGYKDGKYYLYKIWLDIMSQSRFVGFMYDAKDWCLKNNIDTCRHWLENNSLQNPFYEQVLKKLILTVGRERNKRLTVSLDTRPKGDKFTRIEGTLEPIWRGGDLVFNIDEKNNPHMQRMEEQFVGVAPNSKFMDGPDLLEGGVWIIQNRTMSAETRYSLGARQNYHY
ncbi:hypothetical protein GCM10007424_23690 [Flavobacterium suaedae]|uniref:Terminase large subunit gp17-like C-terminal domain-containing protein n=1 Tax=Flavobacterium suaedae TaxID=1767027 RepID=A0ABQ1JZJ3_9FLAO|nr:hypothetical protein [Flavobacterium suaedae]GGB82928.1 hypothetical protein GCM10007424_23690 [Flavobacterium suaedae]